MSDIAIRVENLSKLYRIGQHEKRSDTLAGALVSAVKTPIQNLKRLRRLTKFDDDESGDDVLWSLRDVSFEVKRGEVVGIIGRNGAGKSTLLKILSRITEPTKGRAMIKGRVGSLLEVGTGFHPELTGRENIYMNGTILGMTKAEIDEKFDEIVDFSGVERFLDTPVKRYSSGMKVRLAFSVAAHLDPEILIVDEVLAVGDAEFQTKCLGKMESAATSEGKTVLFVSHNLGAVRSLCSRGLLLVQGALADDGDVASVLNGYLALLDRGSQDLFRDNPERSGDGRARFVSARIFKEDGLQAGKLLAGESMTFELGFENPRQLVSLDCRMTIYNQSGVPVTHFSSRLQGQSPPVSPTGVFRCRIARLPLPPGRYRVAAALLDGGAVCDHLPNILTFDIEGSIFFSKGGTPDARYATVLMDHDWECQATADANEDLWGLRLAASPGSQNG